jgi:hypothetical protein
MTPSFRHSLGVAALATAAWLAGSAHAAEPGPRYAVISVVGDKVSLVHQAPTTSGRTDRNYQREIPIVDKTLDKTVTFAVDDALRAAIPGAEPVMMVWSREDLYALQDDLFETGQEAQAARGFLRETLQKAQVQRLVLVTKHRARTNVKLVSARLGSGNLYGLGFYIERIELEDRETRERGSGYLAPFAYLRVSLVNVDDMSRLRDVVTTETAVVMLPATAASTNPLDALDGVQKFIELEKVIQAAVAKAVPALLPNP